jgi:plastocyanin
MKRVLLTMLLSMAACGLALAADPVEFKLAIKDHKFSPSEIEVPAGVKFKLIVENQDATAEEFESPQLKREKVVAGNGKIEISIGPLTAGKYAFVGEYHEDTAKGTLIAK